MSSLHDFRARRIDGADCALSDYADHVVLVVNVASACGLTPQYAGLQRLHERLEGRGLRILAFPCNQFAGQEPGDEAQIQAYCESHWNVSFPLFSKIEVNGEGAHPLYAWLCAQESEPEGAGPVGWNFGKFLLGRGGELLARFAPTTEPEDADLVGRIEAALG